MERQYFRFLSDVDMRRIHDSSLAILEKTGMLIDHDQAKDILHEAGAKVDHKNNRVRFPPELVEKNLEKIPRKIIFAGRNPEFDMILEPGGKIYSRPVTGETHYVDLKTGEYRRAVISDMKEFANLADALPNIDCCSAIYAGDVPAQTSDVHAVKVLLEEQRKPFVFQTFGVDNLKYLIELMLAVRGSKEEFRKRPPARGTLAIISPLFFSKDNVDMLFLACEYGLPMGIATMANAGATAPITLAGTLAQANAEALGTYVLTQIAFPGQPISYYLIPMVTDMKTGIGMLGSPENALLHAAISQMGREYYKLPIETMGLESEGAICEQTLFQKVTNALMQSLSGGNILMGAGITDSCIAASPIQLTIDNEIMGIVRRILRGIEINDSTLALDVIDRVGPQGNFLSDMHTIEYLRTEEHFLPTIFDRDPRAIWETKGMKGLEEKAREKTYSILEQHEVEPLPEDIQKELNLILKRADEDLSTS